MAKNKRKKKPKNSEVARNFQSIAHYKWEFLRRSEGYIRDCEEWTHRNKTKWHKSEIILGYPYGGKPTDFNTSETLQLLNKKIIDYWELYGGEWSALNNNYFTIEKLKHLGLTLPDYVNSGSWLAYFERWEINLPLNPAVDYLPLFVKIAPKQHINEPAAMGVPGGVFYNDCLLEKGTSSFIEVNWAYPAKYLVHIFKGMVKAKKNWLETGKWHRTARKNLSDDRARFDKFDYYIKILDMHYKEKLSIAQIADKLSKEDPKGKYDDDITRNLTAASELTQGGYKTIG